MQAQTASAFLRTSAALLLIITSTISLPAAAAEAAGAAPLSLLTGPKGGQWDRLGTALVEVLKNNGVDVTATLGGGVENLQAVGDGKADFGFTLYSFMGAAGAGEKELPPVNLDNAVLLANLYPQVLYVIVRKEIVDKYAVKTLGDVLKIKDSLHFATLSKGTGSEFIFNMLLKSAYRTNYDTLEEMGWNISFASYTEISNRFIAGDLDVCAYTAGPGTFLIPALEKAKLEAVLVPVEENVLDLMTHQFMTISYVIAAGDYESVTEDVLTLGDYSCLIVQAGTPDDKVTAINRTLWENRDELAKSTQDILQLSPRFAIAGQSKIHSASTAFWTTPEMEELKKAARRRR